MTALLGMLVVTALGSGGGHPGYSPGLLNTAQAGEPGRAGCPGCTMELPPGGALRAALPAAAGAAGAESDRFFEDEVWAKVGERTCLNCHSATGDASESKFILRDTTHDPAALKRNLAAFDRLASLRKAGKSRLLQKASGGLDHGGGAPLKPGSTAYKILERFVAWRDAGGPVAAGPAPAPFFEGVRMATPERLLRRITLSLAARLPSAPEEAQVAQEGLAAIPAVLESVFKEPAFYERLKEGWNDILLTVGFEGNAEDCLSYDHFEKTRHWPEKYDLSDVPEKDRKKAGYVLWDNYRKALLREPLELIRYIVEHDHPFTEIATADYFMVSPYTARGYGIFEQVKDQFKNVADPFEYIPAHLPALKGRNGKVQPTPSGIYPHAGLLTLFQYLRRYPTTVTNRNRLRARMYYRHFLGIDVMALAPRVTDAAAIGKKFANPTLQAPDCVVCHKTIDPVAGLFQDYFNEEGHYGPRKEGWFTDMFGPGREGHDLPGEEKIRALQWLGQETARDPRFAIAMVEHIYYLLMGRKVLLPPQDIEDPTFTPRRRAYLAQRRAIQAIAERFAASGFNLKCVFKEWILSPFYQVDGLTARTLSPERRAELDDVGLVHMLTPEQLERKILAVFGRPWGRLGEELRILYGGIDSKAVTERMADPSGAMGAIQRIMANDVACKNVAFDFGLEPAKRRLFPGIEPDVVPGSSPEGDEKICRAILHLHAYLLGRDRHLDDPEVERTWRLFAGILEEAHGRKGVDPRENYFCGVQEHRPADARYAIRAWRAVVTYLLRQDDFLYE